MKALLAICMTIVASFGWAVQSAAPAQPAATAVKGEVLETKDVDAYTYIRLKTRDGETWAAVGKTPVKTGSEVTIENISVMIDFESKTLKKTFPKILFGTLAGASGASGDMATAHSGIAKVTDVGDVHVPKAAGPNARTVAEVVTKSATLKDKPVVVRGKVVKYNPEIMGKNWIHLRDGSGSAADNSNDILVTTANTAKPGDVLTAKGTVRTDKDFGAGYAYKVIIEDATLQP